MKTRLISLVTLLLGASLALHASNDLFRNGKSGYVIAVGQAASASEQTAARELQQYIEAVGGVRLPIVNYCPSGKFISVGYNNLTQEALGGSVPQATDESFVCRSKDGNLYIYGGRDRGTMYGVYAFLEKYLGIRWYTPEYTKIPKMDRCPLEEVDFRQSPAIKYRFVQYRNAFRDAAWMAHNRNNATSTALSNEYGGISGYWGCHTSAQFIPPAKYFETHPEYFSLRDGKRVADSQLCLTNPDVLRLCIEAMKNTIAQHPDYWVYDMSQNDNFLWCECPRCKAMEDHYGGHSGLFLWFVNRVADAIRADWPDKYIGTFAYQYTRQAPRNIVPRDNVLIRLCSIECDFSHPIAETAFNRPFLKDLQDWSKIAPTLFIWDYVVNFNQYLAPYPNFGVLAANIKTFRDHHAIGIQEEAQYQSDGAEFSEMKAWVLARLLWDPEQDTDALVKEFITDYYGPAAPQVQAYFDLCRSRIQDDTVMGFAFDQNHPLYDDAFVEASWKLLEAGRAAVSGDAELTARIDRVRAQILFLKEMRNPEASKADGTKDELLRIIREGNIRVREWQSNEQFINSLP